MPCSTITPPSMKTTRSPTSRAKPISWVTTIIVIPSAASSRITSSTSLTSSGSRALVTSSKSITCGSIASARAIATRCCWPPESRSGYSSSLSARPTRSSSAVPFARASSLERPSTFSGAIVTFCRAVRWGKRLNCWKTIPTRWRTKSSSQPASPAGARALADVVALEEDLALLGRLEQVDAAQQGALARAARPEHADDFAARRPRGRSRAAPRGRRSVCGSPPVSASARPIGRCPSGASTWAAPPREVRRCSRAISLSTSRASGRTTIRNMIAPRVSAELLKVFDWMSLPTRATSLRAITLTRVVSFSSAMNSFSIGAITLRTAWGTITLRIAWPWLIPSDRAASIWPLGHRFDPGPVDLRHSRRRRPASAP